MSEQNQRDAEHDREYVEPAADWVRDQLATIDRTGDTGSVGVQGMSVVVVTMLGKSGRYRRVPVMRVEHDGRYAVVASAGGAPKHPVWYHSIAANPDVELMDGTRTGDYVAHLATGAERDEWWPRCVEAFPPYAEYQTKTDRQIPVFVCVPA